MIEWLEDARDFLCALAMFLFFLLAVIFFAALIGVGIFALIKGVLH